MSIPKDYYEILEVHPKASNDIIRKAYLTLAKRYHSDANPSKEAWATEKMKDVNEAYNVLNDLDKRRRYDSKYCGNNIKVETDHPSNETPPRTHAPEVVQLYNQLVSICQQIINDLDSLIIKNETAVIDNGMYCIKYMQIFDTQAMPIAQKLYPFMDQEHELFRDAMDWCALTLYILASKSTWANLFVVAENLLNRALSYKPSGELATKIASGMPQIKRNADLERQYSNKQPNSITATENKPKKWLWIVAAMIVFLWFINSGSPSTPHPKSPPVATTSKSLQAVQPTPAKPPFTPILDKPTGYDPQFKQRNNDGLCQLTIDNTRNSYPVYVKLYNIDAGVPMAVRAFYIQKGATFAADDISPGRYDVRYRNLQTGNLSKTEQFTLRQIPTATGTQYSTVSFTLYTVSGGNTRMSGIDESQFQ